MTRAILIVLNSVGCGGAEDAASYGDEGADTLGHIAEACAKGLGDREGLRRGPLRLPRLESLGLGQAMKASTGRAPPGFALARAARPVGLWNRDVARQGHAVRPLGACRRAGRFRLGLFPADDPRLPRMAYGSDDRRGRAHRHPRQSPRFRDGGDRRLWRGAPANAPADLLHLRRFGAPDRRARRGVRPRASLCALPPHTETLRQAEDRTGHRPAFSRRERQGLRPDRQPQGLSRFPRRTAISCSGPRAPAVQSSPSARSATYSPIATPGPSARARATTAMSSFSSRRSRRPRRAGLIFVNLVDFDTEWGHRRDVPGYAACLEAFDARLGAIEEAMQPTDYCVITADHGNDPTYPRLRSYARACADPRVRRGRSGWSDRRPLDACGRGGDDRPEARPAARTAWPPVGWMKWRLTSVEKLPWLRTSAPGSEKKR